MDRFPTSRNTLNAQSYNDFDQDLPLGLCNLDIDNSAWWRILQASPWWREETSVDFLNYNDDYHFRTKN